MADGRLMGVASELNRTSGQEQALRRSLEEMEAELRHVNQTLGGKQELLLELLTSGFTDQFEKVKRWSAQSALSAHRCNASVSGPSSPVEQSAETRNKTEQLLHTRKQQLLASSQAHSKALSQLHDKLQPLEQQERSISTKVCGGHRAVNGTCPECGGAGCRGPEGGAVCGGQGCNGTVSASKTALINARNVTDFLTAADDDLNTVAKKLQDLVTLTQTVKNQARSSLQKAQKKKEQLDQSNRQLKDFIKKIKDFLTEEGADPDSIQKVALQVLSISVPVNRTALDSMVSQIKDSLSNLTNLEELVNHTGQHVGRARELLLRAQDAKRRAEGVKEAANQTKDALGQSEKAIQEASAALRGAEHNLNLTRNSTAEVEQRLAQLEDRQVEVMMRLLNLSSGVDALRNKSQVNQQGAAEALVQSNTASEQASSLGSRLNETERRFQELQGKLASVGAGAGGLDSVSERAQDMRRQAEELLSQASRGMEQLKKLEKKFRVNEQRMQKQRSELEELKGNVTFVRDEIREQVQKYSNCA